MHPRHRIRSTAGGRGNCVDCSKGYPVGLNIRRDGKTPNPEDASGSLAGYDQTLAIGQPGMSPYAASRGRQASWNSAFFRNQIQVVNPETAHSLEGNG